MARGWHMYSHYISKEKQHQRNKRTVIEFASFRHEPRAKVYSRIDSGLGQEFSYIEQFLRAALPKDHIESVVLISIP